MDKTCKKPVPLTKAIRDQKKQEARKQYWIGGPVKKEEGKKNETK